MRRIAFIVFGLSLLAGSPLVAAEDTQDKDDVCAFLKNATQGQKDLVRGLSRFRSREEACRSAYWAHFPAVGPELLLEAEDYRAYDDALQRRDCDTSLALVINAFVATYPNARNILENDSDLEEWKGTPLTIYFPRLKFCLRMRDFSEAQAEIERRGIAARRLQIGPRDERLPPIVQQRNDALLALLNWHEYLPAQLAIARLAHDGKVIRFVPQYQYYFLLRLLLRRVKPDEIADMLAAAQARLQPAQIEDLKRRIRARNNTGPEPATE